MLNVLSEGRRLYTVPDNHFFRVLSPGPLQDRTLVFIHNSLLPEHLQDHEQPDSSFTYLVTLIQPRRGWRTIFWVEGVDAFDEDVVVKMGLPDVPMDNGGVICEGSGPVSGEEELPPPICFVTFGTGELTRKNSTRCRGQRRKGRNRRGA